jgi:plastocyanin
MSRGLSILTIASRRRIGTGLIGVGLIGVGLAGVGLVGAAMTLPAASASVTATTAPLTLAPPTTAPSTTAPSTTAPPTTAAPVTDPFQPVAPPAPAATLHVSIVDFAFSPAAITVTAGTTVTWTNTGSAIHSVTSDTGAFDSSPSCPGGPCISPGSSYSHLFSQAGRFSYHCRVHPFMTGTVVVNAATTTTTATTTPTSTPGSAPASAGGAATPTTAAPTGSQLAFTGTSSEELWLAFGALFAIAVGLALRPRRRPFPALVPSEPLDRS